MLKTMDNNIIKRRRLVESSEGMLEDVLPLLIENAFLDGKDLEILAMTSKELHKAATNDSLWRSLCHSHFPFTKTIELSEREVMGHRWWYWECQVGPPSDDDAPMPPPSCNLEDVSIVVNVIYKGKAMSSIIFHSDELDHLIREGSVRIPIPVPLVFGRADKWQRNRGKYIPESWPNQSDLYMTMTILRSNDKVMTGMCKICTKDDEFVPIEASSLNGTEDGYTLLSNIDLGSVKKGLVYCGDHEGFCLRNSPLAFEILSRMLVPAVYFNVEIELDLYEGKHVAATGLLVKTEEYDDNAVIFSDFESRHGVTLLHYLSELAGEKYGR